MQDQLRLEKWNDIIQNFHDYKLNRKEECNFLIIISKNIYKRRNSRLS